MMPAPNQRKLVWAIELVRLAEIVAIDYLLKTIIHCHCRISIEILPGGSFNVST